MVCLTLEKKPTFHNITKLRGAQAPQKEENKMTLTQTIEWENDVYIVEYVMSSVSNTIKIVEMTKNGKFPSHDRGQSLSSLESGNRNFLLKSGVSSI